MILWTENLVKDLARKALELNIKFCKSRAISNSFTVNYQINPPHINVYTPYYWAKYYQKGVDFVRTPKKGEFLIWFKNPEDDPRIAPVPQGYPVKRSDVRPLDKEEYKYAKQMQQQGKAVFAKEAGPIPAHDWTPQVYLFWTIYAKIQVKKEMSKRIKKVLEPLHSLKIG